MAVDYYKFGNIVTITLNRPEVMNAFDWPMRRELREALDRFQNDSELWVGILTGAGDKAFSTGADLSPRINADNNIPATKRNDYSVTRGYEIRKPLIAAINGYCLGLGLETALLCDIRIAAEHAQLGLPEVRRGFLPLGGGPLRLPRILNWCHASEILLTGKHITAQEAFRMGLVNRVVPSEKLVPTAMEWAKNICQAAPLAVKAAKEAMINGYGMTLEKGTQLVMSLFEQIQNTEDYAEGRRAFIERRTPNYKGR